MRLFILLFLMTDTIFAQAIKPNDDIECLGTASNHQPVRLKTEVVGKRKKIKVVIGEDSAQALYEASYNVTFFHSLSGPDGQEELFHINAHREDGQAHYVQIVLDLEHLKWAATLTMTLSDTLRTAGVDPEIRLSSCQVTPKAPKMEMNQPKTNSSCSIL